MKVHYQVLIEDPKNHMVKVQLCFKRPESQTSTDIFLPSWSPGSYLMREYARHVRWFKAETCLGLPISFAKIKKGVWRLDWTDIAAQTDIVVSYEVFCHELTVRTSHIDQSHAFLHGPSYLMGILKDEQKHERLDHPSIEFKFPPLWSKITTGLKDISEQRAVFKYTAPDYDTLIDAPVEIGCHQTDGFSVNGVDHELAFYGESSLSLVQIKTDMKKIVQTITDMMGGCPYHKYSFITHFVPKMYGGLEHGNSTTLHFDGRKLKHRKDYLNWLSLVAHEFFHTWNVKRIRPKELGPFDYLNENYTRMLWLAEGLTSFMDDLLVYRAGLCTLEEYLDVVKGNFDSYFQTPGRKFQSLETSSFDAWIKLYRPDENSRNSSMSYYLKGGLCFMALHCDLVNQGKRIDDLLCRLWSHYLANPCVGLDESTFFSILTDLSSAQIATRFQDMVTGVEEIDFSQSLRKAGLDLNFHHSETIDLGLEWEFKNERAVIKVVLLDGPAYKAGLNAGDEVLALNHYRFLKEDAEQLTKLLVPDEKVNFLISRLDKIEEVAVIPGRKMLQLKEITIHDRHLATQALLH